MKVHKKGESTINKKNTFQSSDRIGRLNDTVAEITNIVSKIDNIIRISLEIKDLFLFINNLTKSKLDNLPECCFHLEPVVSENADWR